jgi:glycyl-tRNA synthetase beta chain
MGGYYAAKEGLPQEVVEAIRDHYKPVGQGDEVPTAPVTVAVSLADKLDTIACFFAAEEKPTGSKDPFALRRAALGAIGLIIRNGIRHSLKEGLETSWLHSRLTFFDQTEQRVAREVIKANGGLREFFNEILATERRYSTYQDADQPGWIDADANHASRLAALAAFKKDVVDFFADRLKVQQREKGVRHDLIDAVFALGGEDDLVRLLARVHALQAFITTADGANLLAAYKRAANILKKEGFAADEGVQALSYTPEPAEQALIDALDAATPRAAQAVAQERFADAMAALATLRAPIDRFFDEVTVNAEEADKRRSRLALLARFRDAVHQVADFSRIEG